MTIAELFDKVDWSLMVEDTNDLTFRIHVSEFETCCPIKAALGGTNCDAVRTAIGHDMTFPDAVAVVQAADGAMSAYCTSIRADMRRRMQEAKR